MQMNLADCTDNTWASCFQVHFTCPLLILDHITQDQMTNIEMQETAEKILDIKADELGRLQQDAEEDYNQVFAK